MSRVFREEDYMDPDDPYMTVEVPRNGCTWMGFLLERKAGGFDLFYDHGNSYFNAGDRKDNNAPPYRGAR